MTSTSATCKNCGSPLNENFCQRCGQKSDIHRITFKHLAHEFFHAITHADKGFLFLIKELISRPGFVAREYLDGKRKKYFNPLTFFVICSAIWALVVSKAHYFESIYSSRSRASGSSGSGMPEWLAYYFSQSMKLVITQGKLVNLIILGPMLALLTWVFFFKKKINYAENLVLHAFLVGFMQLGLVIFFIPAFLLFGHAQLNNYVYQGVFMIYLMIAYQQFFRNHLAITILKTVVIQFLFVFMFFWAPLFAFVFVRDLF